MALANVCSERASATPVKTVPASAAVRDLAISWHANACHSCHSSSRGLGPRVGLDTACMSSNQHPLDCSLDHPGCARAKIVSSG
jgi:hypothetical protein